LSCFKKLKPPVAIEVESSLNFLNPQVKSNAQDLKFFKRIYPNAKIFHITTSQIIDFNKEFSNPRFSPSISVKRVGKRW